VGVVTTPSVRRIGAADSKTRGRLLDAAEQILLREGHAAVTSRRVGTEAGLKPQLVHYYFRSMDDLLVEVFRRRADERLARAERVVAGACSLRTIWEVNADPRGAAFNIEFVALAKHNPAVRAEVARYAERYRAMQVEALSSALEAAAVSAHRLPPIVALLLMTGLTQVVSLERTLGVTAGHDETISFVTALIDRLEVASSRGGPDPSGS
jgi:AcrR family transcriptional regulator